MPRDASPIPAPVGLRPERHRAAPAAPTLAAAAQGTLPPAASECWPRVARRELLVALAPCLVLAAGISLAWPVTVDDAFISLRHARILVEHGELSFNADERVEGYSNFSEVLLAAALLARGIEPLGVIKALCSVAALACVPLLYLLSRRLGATHAFALLGALLLALSTGLAFWSASGLETAFHTLLVTAGVLLFLRRRSRLDLLGAALLALAALTRVEAPVLVVAIAVARLLVERAEGRGWLAVARRNAPWLCLFGILYGVYFLWRFLYFGHLFPNPVYFKRAAGWEGLGESHTLNFVRSSWPLLLLAGASLREAGRRHWACLALVATALMVFLSARTLVLGDVSTMGFYDRYFVPVLPCLIAPAMLALSRAWSRSAAASRERLAILGCAAALLLWQLASPGANWLHLAGRAGSYPRAVETRNVPAVAYLDQRFGPQGRVIAGDVGRLAYGFRGAVDDLFGLNSYAFTLRFQGDIAAYGAYLLERRPDAILLCRDDRNGRFCHHAEAVLAGLPGFARHYREVRRFGRRRVPGAHFVIYEGVETASRGG